MFGCDSRASSVPSRVKVASACCSSQPQLKQLERHRALVAAVAAVGFPDHAHSAGAERHIERVGANRRAGQIRFGVGERRRVKERRVEQPFVRAQQARENLAGLRVGGAHVVDEAPARIGVEIERLVEERADGVPRRRVEALHGFSGNNRKRPGKADTRAYVSSSSSRSSTRALAQSR